jgi:hypothetical protein
VIFQSQQLKYEKSNPILLSKINFYDKNALNFKYEAIFLNLNLALNETTKIIKESTQ